MLLPLYLQQICFLKKSHIILKCPLLVLLYYTREALISLEPYSHCRQIHLNRLAMPRTLLDTQSPKPVGSDDGHHRQTHMGNKVMGYCSKSQAFSVIWYELKGNNLSSLWSKASDSISWQEVIDTVLDFYSKITNIFCIIVYKWYIIYK